MRRHVTYANVASTLALVCALGTGGAYAATTIAKNSVGTPQLKNNAVVSSKVKDHSLLASDFKAGQLKAGPRGLPGKNGVNAYDTLPSGTTETGDFGYDSTTGTKDTDDLVLVSFPVTIPATPTGIHFAPDAYSATTSDDPDCSGTKSAPTAPPGMVCVYVTGLSDNVSSLATEPFSVAGADRHGFFIQVDASADNADIYAFGTWAYTAP